MLQGAARLTRTLLTQIAGSLGTWCCGGCPSLSSSPLALSAPLTTLRSLLSHPKIRGGDAGAEGDRESRGKEGRRKGLGVLREGSRK